MSDDGGYKEWQMQQTIDALTAVAEQLREHHKLAVEQWTLEAQNVKVLEEENEQLRAEILAHMTRQAQCQGEYDERQRDAERYRWLKDHYCAAVKFRHPTQEVIVIDDAAIDAAMQKGE